MAFRCLTCCSFVYSDGSCALLATRLLNLLHGRKGCMLQDLYIDSTILSSFTIANCMASTCTRETLTCCSPATCFWTHWLSPDMFIKIPRVVQHHQLALPRSLTVDRQHVLLAGCLTEAGCECHCMTLCARYRKNLAAELATNLTAS